MPTKSPIALPFVCFIFFLHSIPVTSTGPLAPALYVFGDSLSDGGNNNYLRNTAKANYKPYGIDLKPGNPTGRFSNGKTTVDFIAQFLGLPIVPAYLGLSNLDKMKITTGVNYASGGAGILPDTGHAIGEVLSLDKQISYFERTIKNDLSKIFKTPFALSKHLANSILYVAIGSNDYLNNYLQGNNYNRSLTHQPQQFADFLLEALKKQLLNLYKLGGRKFVVFNIARVGCVPGIVHAAKPPTTSACVEDANKLVLLYNTKFPNMITSLERYLRGSTFVQGDVYSMKKTSAEAGFLRKQIPCCKYNPTTGLCLKDSIPCSVRTTGLFWDAFHPTEKVNEVSAADCFRGRFSCSPINIQQLALKQGVRIRPGTRKPIFSNLEYLSFDRKIHKVST